MSATVIRRVHYRFQRRSCRFHTRWPVHVGPSADPWHTFQNEAGVGSGTAMPAVARCY